MTDDIERRVSSLERNVSSLAQKVSEFSIYAALAEERQKHMDHRFDEVKKEIKKVEEIQLAFSRKIDGAFAKVLWIIATPAIVALVAWLMNGGISNVAG